MRLVPDRLALQFIAICSLAGCGSSTEPGTGKPPDPTLDDPSGSWKMVAVGEAHTCGITKGDAAYCWGANDRNQLGDSTKLARSTPTAVATGLRFTSIYAGRYTSCGIAESGEAYCWGFYNTSTPTPRLVTAGRRFTMLAVGQFKVCGLASEGSVSCWTTINSDPTSPTDLPGGLSFRSLTSAETRFCGVTNTGEAYCWLDAVGWSQSIPQIQPVNASRKAVSIAAGDLSELSNRYLHVCASYADSTIGCWGANNVGQLGDSTYVDRQTDAVVRGQLRFAAVYATIQRSCGVSVSGQTYCWGIAMQCVTVSLLGSGSTPECSLPGGLVSPGTPKWTTPTPWLGGIRIATLALGQAHGCAITNSGALYCWGANDGGQLGIGDAGGSFGNPRRVIDPAGT
jgi:alpha-tubulin suppressor-like RCC1 family protein